MLHGRTESLPHCLNHRCLQHYEHPAITAACGARRGSSRRDLSHRAARRGQRETPLQSPGDHRWTIPILTVSVVFVHLPSAALRALLLRSSVGTLCWGLGPTEDREVTTLSCLTTRTASHQSFRGHSTTRIFLSVPPPCAACSADCFRAGATHVVCDQVFGRHLAADFDGANDTTRGTGQHGIHRQACHAFK